MKTKIIQFIVLLQTAVVLAVNYFAAAGWINNTDTGAVSAAYPTSITPSGYAFAIWSLIYAGTIAFSIYQLLPRQADNVLLARVRLPYIALCAANIGWIFAWHYNLIPSSLVLMFCLLVLLAIINLAASASDNSWDTWLVAVPFSIYFGWVTVATILNTTITLVYYGVSLSETATLNVGVLLIAIAVAIGGFLRFKLDSMAYPLAIAWGVTAIGVGQGGKTRVVVASAIGLMILMFVAFWGYVKDRTTPIVEE